MKSQYSRNLETYFRYGTTKSSVWQYFNPSSRVWSYIKVHKLPYGKQDHSIILRNGWIVRKLERIVESPYYYYCENDEIRNISKRDAVIKGYQYSPGILKVPAVKKEDNVFVDVRKVYFPTDVFNELRELSVMQNEDGGRILYICFKSADIQKVYRILYQIRVRLEYQDDFIDEVKDLDPTEIETLSEVPKFISEILTMSYSNFLKKEDRIEKFLLALIYRDMTKISNDELKQKLQELFSYCDKGDFVCEKILDFLIESITTYFDWGCFENWNVNQNIDGLIFKATPQSYSEKWSNTYYKIIFPEFEMVLHWPTTLSPTRKGTGEFYATYARLKHIKMRRWRIYPYLGRIKNTGTRDDNIFEEGERNFIRRSFDSVLGIPSFERILAEREYLSSFSLDLEDWHGHYFLDRYFLAIVKIIDPLLLDSPFPRTKVEDIFGNKFIVEWNWDAYHHSKDDIHNFGIGGWFSILLKNVFGKRRFVTIDSPIFQTAQTIKPIFHNKEFAQKFNILALIKYFGYIPRKEINSLSVLPSESSIDDILEELLKENLVYEKDGRIYYVYKCLNTEQMAELVELMTVADKIPQRDMHRQRWYITWSLIRGHYPIVHPLIYANKLSRQENLVMSNEEATTYKKIEDFINKISDLHKKEIRKRRADKINFFINNRNPDIVQNEIKIGKKDEESYARYASLMINNFGNVTILGSGGRIPKAHAVVREVVRKFAYMEPKVVRTDSPLQHPGGFTVPAVKYEIEMFGI